MEVSGQHYGPASFFPGMNHGTHSIWPLIGARASVNFVLKKCLVYLQGFESRTLQHVPMYPGRMLKRAVHIVTTVLIDLARELIGEVQDSERR